MYHIFFIHSSVYGPLHHFYTLAMVNNAAVNIGVLISVQTSDFISFRYILISGIARSYGSSIFNFVRNFHNVFHSGCTNIHSQQQCIRIPFSPHPCQHLLLLVFFIIAILTSVRWHLTVALIFISLLISDVEHLFMYLLAICISFLEKCLFRSSAHFLIWLSGFFYSQVILVFYIFWILTH